MANQVAVQREQVKALLKKAQLEINSTAARVDGMGTHELAEIRGMTQGLRAFFDTNGTCAAGDIKRSGKKVARVAFDPRAIFDTNGTCEAIDPGNLSAFFDTNGTC